MQRRSRVHGTNVIGIRDLLMVLTEVALSSRACISGETYEVVSIFVTFLMQASAITTWKGAGTKLMTRSCALTAASNAAASATSSSMGVARATPAANSEAAASSMEAIVTSGATVDLDPAPAKCFTTGATTIPDPSRSTLGVSPSRGRREEGRGEEDGGAEEEGQELRQSQRFIGIRCLFFFPYFFIT